MKKKDKIGIDILSWKRLTKGLKNNNQGLTKKAELFTLILLSSCFDASDEFSKIFEKDKLVGKKAEEDWLEIFYEYVFLFLHLADRVSLNLLGAKKRNIFMDALVVEIDKALLGSSINPKTPEGFHWMEVYNSRQKEYSKYRMPLKEEKSYKGNIFWEFGKKIASILDRPKDATIIMPTYLLGAHTFFSLNLKTLLEEK